jgi:hypothetical protein
MNFITAIETLLWAGLGLFVLDTVMGFPVTLRAYRCIAWVFINLELAALKVIHSIMRPEFVLQGDCMRCGACCEHIVGDPPRFIKHTKLLPIYLAYHRFAHRFTATHRGPNGEVIFSCGHLQHDGRCGIYRFRPLICRNYPVIPYYNVPGLLPDCTYTVAPRVVAQMKSRPSLPILNAQVMVHHPTRIEPGPSAHEDFHLVDPIGGALIKPKSCDVDPSDYKNSHAPPSPNHASKSDDSGL